MGGSTPKRLGQGLLTGGLSEAGRAAGAERLDPGKAGREAERQAKASQAAQSAQIAEQTAREKQRIAEETSEIERRRALARRGSAGGRSLLVATSPRGVTKLGGTNA